MFQSYSFIGVATLKVRVPAQAGGEGGTNMITVEVKLADPAIKLQEIIASKLNVSFEKYANKYYSKNNSK